MTAPLLPGLVDDHLHSTAGSADALNTPAEMCAQALALGLRRVCFTEHVDYDTTLPEYGYHDPDRVIREVTEARAACGEALEIAVGIEVDFRPEFLPVLLDDLPRYQVDFVLGSVHSYRGCHLLEIRRMKPHWTPDELSELYAEYFRDTRALIATGMIDSLAHFDYPSKLNLRPEDPTGIPGYMEELTATLALAVQHDVAIEVNTKRAHRDAPLAASEAILRHYCALGGTRVTMGSDAHRLKDLGAALPLGAQALAAAGFPGLTIYRARAPLLIPVMEEPA